MQQWVVCIVRVHGLCLVLAVEFTIIQQSNSIYLENCALVSKIRMVQALVPRLFAQGTWDLNSFFIFLMIMTSS